MRAKIILDLENSYSYCKKMKGLLHVNWMQSQRRHENDQYGINKAINAHGAHSSNCVNLPSADRSSPAGLIFIKNMFLPSFLRFFYVLVRELVWIPLNITVGSILSKNLFVKRRMKSIFILNSLASLSLFVRSPEGLSRRKCNIALVH